MLAAPTVEGAGEGSVAAPSASSAAVVSSAASVLDGRERLLLGFETSDDAAVWKLSDDTAAVLTVDFFTPIVDDPYEFGRIAAANALSDVFAMGATPHVALNLLALDCELGSEVAAAILRGGARAVREAGAFVAGGHTIDDAEPKYGLTVFGTVHPDRIVRNAGALPGDVLYVTKPLGTGIMVAARACDLVDDAGLRPAVESMMELNATGAAALAESGVHAATDVTGFGLAGHLHELLEASGCAAAIDYEALPLFEGVEGFARAYCRPNRLFTIMDRAEDYVVQGTLDDEEYDNRLAVICDPQTSGGLLAAVPPEAADTFERAFEARCGRAPARIGQVKAGEAGIIRFTE